jgi:predicted nucleic acid-binding protein
VTDEIWIINASPLILLGKLGRTDFLERLARQVIVPQAVFREIAAGATGDVAMEVALGWAATRVQDDILVPPSISAWDLGAGESQVLSHCLAGGLATGPYWMMAKHARRPRFTPCHWLAVWVSSCAPARQG